LNGLESIIISKQCFRQNLTLSYIFILIQHPQTHTYLRLLVVADEQAANSLSEGQTMADFFEYLAAEQLGRAKDSQPGQVLERIRLSKIYQ
jgi:hypothetical protein